jgi:hypothetical protein
VVRRHGPAVHARITILNILDAVGASCSPLTRRLTGLAMHSGDLVQCSTPDREEGQSWKHSRVECLHNLMAHRRIRLVWAEEYFDLVDHLLEQRF